MPNPALAAALVGKQQRGPPCLRTYVGIGFPGAFRRGVGGRKIKGRTTSQVAGAPSASPYLLLMNGFWWELVRHYGK